MEDLTLNDDDLFDNPTARVPVCLCLDTSTSMSGAKIEQLNQGVQQFFDAIREDDVAQHAAEIAIVTFGARTELLLDFAAIQRQEVPTLTANGATPMGAGVNLALDQLESRKAEYAEAGIEYYQPWLVLMTDGAPTDPIDGAVRRATELLSSRRLSLFPIGIGEDADMARLRQFSPSRPPLRLQGLKFSEFFEWLSKSVSRVSQSIPGESVPLDVDGLSGWAEV